MSNKAPINIAGLFFKAATLYPEIIAIQDKNREVNYADLESEVKRAIGYYESKGIKRGTKVIVLIPMSIELYRTVLALFSIGAICVFFDEWSSLKRIKQGVESVQPEAIITTPKLLIASWFVASLRSLPIRLSSKIKSNDLGTKANTNYEDSALITFTTGSTGVAKAANRTHGFLYEQFTVLNEKISLDPGEKAMVLLPIVLLINLAKGASSIIADYNSRKPELLNLPIISKQLEGVSTVIASPYFILKLSENKFTNNISKLFTGGAPVFPEDAKKIETAFPNANLNIVYGSTEAEPISTCSSKDLIMEEDNILRKGLYVGELHPKLELKIIEIRDKSISVDSEEEFLNLELMDGKMGEIIVCGDHVLKSYYNSDIAFKENKIVVGNNVWHRTGDSARKWGYKIYLNGRAKGIIIKDGKHISPFIIEYILKNIEGVNIGTIMEIDNEINIIIEPAGFFDINVVKNELENKSVSYDEIIQLKEIPKDPRHFSKIDYGLLRQKLAKK